MTQVEDIKVLNIDGVPYDVEMMSDEVKNMVAVFNDWNRKEVEVRSELMMVQSAKNDLSRNIILQVRKEKEEQEGAGETTAEGINEAEWRGATDEAEQTPAE